MVRTVLCVLMCSQHHTARDSRLESNLPTTCQEEADKIREEYIAEPTAALAAATAEYDEAESALERVASGAEASTSVASGAAADADAPKRAKPKAGKRKRAGGAAADKAEAAADRLAAAGLAAQSWWLEAVDMLVVQSTNGGAAAARHIKAQLGDLDSCAFNSPDILLRSATRPQVSTGCRFALLHARCLLAVLLHGQSFGRLQCAAAQCPSSRASTCDGRYNHLSSQNVASLARRFRTGLPGLKLLLAGDLDAVAEAETASLAELRDLQEGCQHPTPELIEQAAHCGRYALGKSGQAPRLTVDICFVKARRRNALLS